MTEEREERNKVFSEPDARQKATQAGVDPSIQVTTAVDSVKAEFGIDIPVETVPLPSAGKAYPPSSTLHLQEMVDIRAMTTREEDILTSQALLKKGTVISELIRSCLVNKDIQPVELLVGDRNAVMVAIRITGYGSDYDAEVQCGECDVKSSQTFDLGALPLKRLELEPVELGMNVFEFTLPATKKRVRFKYLTGRDEEEILATQQKQQKLGLSSDALVTTNLLYSLVAVEGVEDRSRIAKFVRMMPARDSLALRNYMRDNEPGIRMRQSVECPSCGNVEEVGMPMGVNFLWPSSAR